jgi:hypothetical protein
MVFAQTIKNNVALINEQKFDGQYETTIYSLASVGSTACWKLTARPGTTVEMACL